jgi:putative aldouronate transport system substrate-binding protein
MRKIVSMLLALTMLLSVFSFSGMAIAESDKELMTLEIYDVAANYQGVQVGWFGKIVKDKFNLELNIIAPQVSGGNGDALYQTRTASGNLGDIILLDNWDLQDCIEAGLVYDISDYIVDYPNLMGFDKQIDAFNATLGDGSGKTYAIPCQMTNTSISAHTEEKVYTSPQVPWDYYTELGSPTLNNLDDLLNMLVDMQAAHPTNEAGDPVYAISLWPDWDSSYMENVAQLTPWYGYQTKESLLISGDNDIMPLTDDNGAYLKMLKFLYDANKLGIVDPDSGTQNWDNMYTKLCAKQVLLLWYSWQTGFWNTPDRANNRDAYIYIPVADQSYVDDGDPYYGDGRSFAIGSQVSDEKRDRILEFLEWLAGPEGATYQHAGLPGWSYTVNEDGTYTQTTEGEYQLMQNLEVPAEFGGGGYNDGNCAINQWVVAGVSINPETNEPYSTTYWSSTIEKNKTTMTKEWAAQYGAENQVKYLLANNKLIVTPKVNVSLGSDTTDIALIRGQCGQLIKDTSWQMVFAEDEDTFNAMWVALKEQLNGNGWEELVAFDTAKYQKLIDARVAALE